MIVGPNCEILHSNQATDRLFGYGSGLLSGRSVFEVLPVNSIAEFHALIEPPATDTVLRGMEGKTESGQKLSLAIQITAWTDPEGGLQHALALREISDEQEETRLTMAELKRATNAVKSAHIGVFEYNPLTDSVVLSDVLRELMELDPDKQSFQQEWLARVHPDDLEAALEPIRLCLAGVDERNICEYRLKSRNGSLWRWMRSDMSIAKRDKTGQVTSLVGAMTDITELKTTETALRRSVQQFRSFFENAPIGKAIVGLDGKLLQVNAALCDLFGYSKDELMATDFGLLTHPEDLSQIKSRLELLRAGKLSNYEVEKRCVRADGVAIWILLKVDMVKDANGKPEHFITQIIDMTEQRQLDEMKGEFVAIVSHELRTPLTSVLGALTLLSSMDDLNSFSEEAKRLIFIAQENGERLNALVDDILDFEKFSARQMRFDLSRQRIAELIEEALLANLPFADKFSVQLDFKCSDSSLKGVVDPLRFQQVMTNLLSNASKFANKGSTITVTAEGQQTSILISVTNEGDGIPKTFQDQVFKPFSQAVPAATRARNGTGLGLSISKEMVEQMGGAIGFDCAQAGKTVFWFTVPLNEPA